MRKAILILCLLPFYLFGESGTQSGKGGFRHSYLVGLTSGAVVETARNWTPWLIRVHCISNDIASTNSYVSNSGHHEIENVGNLISGYLLAYLFDYMRKVGQVIPGLDAEQFMYGYDSGSTLTSLAWLVGAFVIGQPNPGPYSFPGDKLAYRSRNHNIYSQFGALTSRLVVGYLR